MKSSCHIVPPSIYSDQRTVNCSGNSYQINARYCPRQFVKSTALLCLNKYSLAERGEHKKAREGNWGGEDQVWQCLVIYMKQRAGECPEAPSSHQIPHPGGQTLCLEGEPAAQEVVPRIWRITSQPQYCLVPEAKPP